MRDQRMGGLRAIVERTRYRHSSCPRGAQGSVIATLSCGCQRVYKASQEPLLKARCVNQQEHGL